MDDTKWVKKGENLWEAPVVAGLFRGEIEKLSENRYRYGVQGYTAWSHQNEAGAPVASSFEEAKAKISEEIAKIYKVVNAYLEQSSEVVA